MTYPLPSADTATGNAYCVSTHRHASKEEAVDSVLRLINVQVSEWRTSGMKANVESVTHKAGLDPSHGHFATAIVIITKP